MPTLLFYALFAVLTLGHEGEYARINTEHYLVYLKGK